MKEYSRLYTSLGIHLTYIFNMSFKTGTFSYMELTKVMPVLLNYHYLLLSNYSPIISNGKNIKTLRLSNVLTSSS